MLFFKMIEEFKAFTQKHNLFNSEDRLILAVSGGIDSVVLVDLCYRAGYSFAIAHCNFMLRGKDSDADEAFVRSLAEKYGVVCFVKKFNTVQESQQLRDSIQMAARRLRYQWFTALLQQEDYHYVATAHHKNDVFETMLFNLCKGTGIAGLHGIPLKAGQMIRPLLFTERSAIENYAQQYALTWREDSSNASVKYARNLIRLEVIPKLLRINPALFSTLDATLDRLQGTEKVLLQYAKEVKERGLEKKGEDVYLLRSVLQAVEALPVVLAEILKPYGFNYEQSKMMAAQIHGTSPDQVGNIFHAANYTLNLDRKHLIISPSKERETLTYYLGQSDEELKVNQGYVLNCKIQDAKHYQINANPKIAALDLDKLKFPLKIRRWQAGDWFQPLGMKGKKKLSDFMIDHKIPLNLKDRVYVLTSGEAVVWVIGYRIDERFKITSSTQQVFQIIQENLL